MSDDRTPDRLEDELLAALLGDAGFAVDARAIAPRARKEEAPVSSQQRRLWFLAKLDPANQAYVIPGAVRVEGQLDLDVLRGAFEALTARHESLRTTFGARDGVPVQVIHPDLKPGWRVESIDDGADRPGRVLERAARATAEPFDLENGPLLRIAVLREHEDAHLIVLTMHHIVSDGWSMGVLIREVVAFYEQLARGRAPLLAAPLQYGDFAAWQQDWRRTPEHARQLRYWTERLAGVPRLDLPLDRPRPPSMTSDGAVVHTTIDGAAAEAARRFSREAGVTLFMTLLSAFAALLARYTGQTDLAIGTPSANRGRAELEGVIGVFVNALVLRADLSGDPTFAALVDRVKSACLDAWAHQDLPFEEIVEAVDPQRVSNQNPLFQVMFVLQNTPEGKLDIPGLSFSPIDLPTTTAKFDVSLYLVESGSGLSVALEYNRDLFSETTARRMLGHYVRLVGAAIATPAVPLSALTILAADERDRVVAGWNRTAVAYPRERSIHALFEEVTAAAPDRIAGRIAGDAISYGELDRRSNQLARRLRDIVGGAPGTVGPAGIVAIAVERSLEMLVGLLGILKAGCAYLPIDLSQPAERMAFALEDAGVAAAVVQPQTAARLPLVSSKMVVLDRDWSALAAEDDRPVDGSVDARDLAYVTFTSGSTGVPKGVAVPHRAVVRLVRDTDYARLSADEVILQFAPLAFDASTFEIWGALLNGGTVAFAAPGNRSLADLARDLRDLGVTTAWLTAGLFHQMVDHEQDALAGLRQLVAGGDVLSPPHVRRLLEAAPSLRFVNGFGPTETTTFACCHVVPAPPDAREPVPIGRPIANSTAYVLDARLEPVPIGVPGELFLGGDGVARGYLNRPSLTAERFVPDPFAAEPGRRLYRTGDIVRWREDGAIDFIGRRDFQVKLRGFRVELGEIEAALLGHPAVADAAVVTTGAGGERRLVAFVAARRPEDPVDDLRRFLQSRLPDYMVPSAVIVLPTLPLTANGKVDRAQLVRSVADVPPDARASVEPRTPSEASVARIWAEVLHIARVGATDNFFDLGGHSLLATQVVARVRDDLGVEVALRDLFVSPTVEALAAEVDRLRAAPASRAVESIPRSAARTRAGRGSPAAS